MGLKLRVVAALNEKGLDYKLVLVDLRTGAHKQPSFLALNVTSLGDIVLFESQAINQYIASRYKEIGPDLLRSGGGPAETAVVEVWQEVESQLFGPPIADLVFESLIKALLGGPTDPTVVKKQAEKLGKVLDVYETQLSKKKYLAGGHFTLADLNHIPFYSDPVPKLQQSSSAQSSFIEHDR